MFNRDVAIVLVASKRTHKWVPVRYMLKHGLFPANIMYLEDKGYVSVRNDKELGAMIRLTAEGYYAALPLVLDNNIKGAN